MNRLLLVFCVLLIAGCDSRPTVVGLFGEKIGERIPSERCERIHFSSSYEVPESLATMAKVKKPTVAFPIKETEDVTVGYAVITNTEGKVEWLSFNSYVSKRDSIKKWLKAVDAIREDAKKKYGEPDYTGSDKGKGYESEVEGWYIKGRTIGISLSKMKDVDSYSVNVDAMTYEQASKSVAEAYNKNVDGLFRKRWEDMEDEIPSDFVKLVEEKIEAAKAEKDKSYL